MIAAAASFDLAALKAILGPDADYLVATGEPVKDRETASAFAAKAREKKVVVVDPKDPNRATLDRRRPGLAAPDPDRPERRHVAIRREGRAAGDRPPAIGANELDAIQICHGYVEAQHEYALVKHDGASVNQYAQRIISTHRQAGRPRVEERRRHLGGPGRREHRQGHRAGLLRKAMPYHGYTSRS